MRHLTILLDPGRLKHFLGPNAALEPPLKAGEEYELEIGQGMTDLDGQPLGRSYRKRFRTVAAVRQPIQPSEWNVAPPAQGTLAPLTLQFPRALDWAPLLRSITVEMTAGMQIHGAMEATHSETQVRFYPASEWSAGSYGVKVATSLEDPCGNDLIATFDRPYRNASDLTADQPFLVIPFKIDEASSSTILRNQ